MAEEPFDSEVTMAGDERALLAGRYRIVRQLGQGNANGQYFLGAMYERGWGVAKDYSEALRLYRLSADQGYADAQNNLGCMYENGFGVAQNRYEAVRLYRMAANQGEESAISNLRRLGERW